MLLNAGVNSGSSSPWPLSWIWHSLHFDISPSLSEQFLHFVLFLLWFSCYLTDYTFSFTFAAFSNFLHLYTWKRSQAHPLDPSSFIQKKKIYSLDDFIQFYCFKCHLYADNFQIYISSLDFFPRLPAPVSMTTWRPNRQPEPNITETPVSRSTASHALLSWEVPDESGISLFHN